MKKISIIVLSFFFITPNLFALGCVDIKSNLAQTQENASVKLLQDFLFEKGFLQAKPNGYFGVGTLASVKKYQKSINLSQVGVAGPATRAALKKETCSSLVTSHLQATSTKNVSIQKKDEIKESVKIPETKTKTISEENNDKRSKDVETILLGLYNDFLYTGGVIPMPVLDIPKELCVVPQSVINANATATIPVLPCSNFVDITRLSPHRLKNIPRDPKIATTSTLTGYFVTRTNTNDISVIAKNAENGITIKATCNFNNACKNIERISHVFFDVPNLASTSRSVLIKDSALVVPFVLYGKNFTASNTLTLSAKYSNQKYILGTFPSSDGKIITLQAKDLSRKVSCGNSCTQEIPLGDYEISLSNQGGVSVSVIPVSIKGYSMSVVDNSYSVKPDTKNTKFATITFAVDIPVTVKSLTLSATDTVSTLSSKVSRLVAEDVNEGTVSGPSTGVLNLGSKSISAGQIKKYNLYTDVGILAYSEVGAVRYSGYITVTDSITDKTRPADIQIPIKDLFINISY